MSKFRKKPVIISAEQWFPDRVIDGVFKVKDVRTIAMKNATHKPDLYSKLSDIDGDGYGYISTLEGGHIVSPGDWIITGILGEKYPCKPDIFDLTYEPIEDV